MEEGESIRRIAKILKRSPNSISLELRRNKVRRRYNAKKAQHKTYVRRREAKYQGKKIVKDKKLRAFVEKALKEGRSPESIAGRLKKQEKKLKNVSADSIERFLRSVYGRKIESIRKKLKRRQKQRNKRKKVTKLDNRVFIEKRPSIAAKRGRVGDVEADFIISGKSGKGYLLTVTDRKLRVSFFEKVLPVTIKNMEKAFLKIQKRFTEMKTITTDNDILFAKHQELASILNTKIYFCHPYHSWEKGSIENVNKEIRKYIPKGSDISKYTSSQIKKIEVEVNNRYMKCLDFATPQEKLIKHRIRKKRYR